MTLAKYMVCVWRGGSQHLGAPRVLSALEFLPCLRWAKKGAREVPHTLPGKRVPSWDKTCGSPSPLPCDWEQQQHLTHVTPVPPGHRSCSLLKVPRAKFPDSLVRPHPLACATVREAGREGLPGEKQRRLARDLQTCSPEASHPPSLSEGAGWWPAAVFGVVGTVS